MLEIPQPESQNATPIFAEASGKGLEELILDLIREEHPGTNPQINGTTRQEGFDIQVTLHDGTRVFIECKHRQNKYKFKGSELTKAVNKFIKGKMSSWAHEFCLITSGESDQTVVRAKARATALFQERKIKFGYNSRKDLWYRLRKYPYVVKPYLGQYWADISQAWCDAYEAKDRERKRHSQQPTSFLTERCDYYDDGYLKVNFELPTRRFPRIHLSLTFKTDGLYDATILLGNDEVLRVFDEADWPEKIPFFMARNSGNIVLQVGNTLVSVSTFIVQVLIQRIRSVRERWIERIQKLDCDWEAEGFQFLEKDTVKLGQIRTSIWRAMIDFANNHDSEEGRSQWHIFDSGTSLLKVYTEQDNEHMNRGHHLVLSTRPEVTDSTGDDQFVDLVWHAPYQSIEGNIARGQRKYWGCATAVAWLENEFIPMLVNQFWPQHDPRTPLQRLLRRSVRPLCRPEPSNLFHAQTARDWSIEKISAIEDLSDIVAVLQRHYSLRDLKDDATFPDSYLQAVNEALRLVLERTNLPFYGYVASKAGLENNGHKADLLRQLADPNRLSNWQADGNSLEHILRAILDALKHANTTDLNAAECRLIMETLRPLAQSAVDYNRILAHLSKPVSTYPV